MVKSVGERLVEGKDLVRSVRWMIRDVDVNRRMKMKIFLWWCLRNEWMRVVVGVGR